MIRGGRPVLSGALIIESVSVYASESLWRVATDKRPGIATHSTATMVSGLEAPEVLCLEYDNKKGIRKAVCATTSCQNWKITNSSGCGVTYTRKKINLPVLTAKQAIV